MPAIKYVMYPHYQRQFLDRNTNHTVFVLGTKISNDIAVDECFEVCLSYEDRAIHYGMAIVSAVKKCMIGNLDTIDFQRQQKGFRSVKETINTLKKIYPKYNINKATVITVITLKTNHYDLKQLNEKYSPGATKNFLKSTALNKSNIK